MASRKRVSKKYVVKYCGGDSDLENYILTYLDKNANIATFCYIPVTCNFVCMCLQAVYLSNQSGDKPTVNTMTQLYVYARMHLVRTLHPELKNDPCHLDYKATLNKVGRSFMNHANVARCFTITPPIQVIFYNEDINETSAVDRQSGFLDESLTMDEVTRERSQQCWSFTHLTIQEFFAAFGFLVGSFDDISQLTESKESICKQELLLTFVVGLLCDQRNAKFMEYFRTGESI